MTADENSRNRAYCEHLILRDAATARESVTLARGDQLDYNVRAEFVPVMGSDDGPGYGELRAAVFTVSYTVPADGTARPRPVCFVLTGGPGASSLALSLWTMGPKCSVIGDDGTSSLASPYEVVDNPLTWLEHFDLVFIDPPHTGYSVTASDEARIDAFSVDGDVELLAEVVRRWLAVNRRFESERYCAGVSYGTMRAAALADKMQAFGLGFAGVILESWALDYQALMFGPRNDLPYALFLPSYAMAAQYHGRLRGSVGASGEAARAAAIEFAIEEYVSALTLGARLDRVRRDRVATRVSELTALPVELIVAKNLRISNQDFFAHALRDEGLVVGRGDARVTGPAPLIHQETVEFDPSREAYSSAFAAGLGHYAQLGILLDAPYHSARIELGDVWNWRRRSPEGERLGRGGGYASTSTDLARAMRKNPHLRVLVASGYYDLATPFWATDWSLAQLNVPASVLERITHRYYEGGHVVRGGSPEMKTLKSDLEEWLGPN